jgi:hypothetical protein
VYAPNPAAPVQLWNTVHCFRLYLDAVALSNPPRKNEGVRPSSIGSCTMPTGSRSRARAFAAAVKRQMLDDQPAN